MPPRTSWIRLATGICLVPEHNPLVLAKVIASLDRLSGGRFALGVGIGWSAEGFQAPGLVVGRRAPPPPGPDSRMLPKRGAGGSNLSGDVVWLHAGAQHPQAHAGP